MRDELLAAMARVLDSNRFILGPEVEALEREVAALSDVRHGIGVSSGSDALLVALMALDVGPGDEVITTTYTFFATAGAVARLGATPVFVDIEPHGFNLDPRRTVEAIGPRTRAIIPVHLFGRCADMDEIVAAACERGIPVIEDAAQALGATTPDGRPAGSLGAMTCHSFFPSKNLGGFGDGGMVVSDDEALADRVRLLRGHGARPKYHHAEVGGNFRLDALQAAVLRVKLRRLDEVLEGRARAARRYAALFSEIAGDLPIRTPESVPGHTWNQYVIRAERRDALREHLSERGIGTAIYYPIPLHLQACFADLGWGPGDLPEAERAARETLALPIFPEMTEEQARAVVEACAAFYRS
ncbi:MAG: DegT/DnrJ/EryC1/StrS family aminotransferase [Gemmatimonadota bacterium]|nr:DegT/DnrJ/EryC1/StrS family aminotransferase [Gemmatimonadota bacterium]